MLTVGDKLPGLTVPVQQGVAALPAGETLNLGKSDGKWKVLFYWPKDFTFICPTEIVGYYQLKGDFADRNAVLIGASTDTSHVHFAWRKTDEQLASADFPWIADNSKKLAEALEKYFEWCTDRSGAIGYEPSRIAAHRLACKQYFVSP